MYLGFMYLDPLYILLVLPALALALLAQGNVSSTFARFSRVRTRAG